MRSILIIGMGEFGKHLAYRLLDLKADVCIVDENKDLINVLSSDFENAYSCDCTQKVALNELGVKDFDVCVVAIGKDFQTSLEITSQLKEMGAKYIISKASSDLQAKFLKMAGADETIYPEKDMARKIAVTCTEPDLLDIFEISDDYSVYEIKAKKSWIGKSLKDSHIRSRYNINIIAVKNNNKTTIPTADYVFNNDDTLFVFGSSEAASKL